MLVQYWSSLYKDTRHRHRQGAKLTNHRSTGKGHQTLYWDSPLCQGFRTKLLGLITLLCMCAAVSNLGRGRNSLAAALTGLAICSQRLSSARSGCLSVCLAQLRLACPTYCIRAFSEREKHKLVCGEKKEKKERLSNSRKKK